MLKSWKEGVAILLFMAVCGSLFITAINFQYRSRERAFNANVAAVKTALAEIGCDSVIMAKIESPSLIIEIHSLHEFVSVAKSLNVTVAYYEDGITTNSRKFYVFTQDYAIAYRFQVTTKLEE